MTSKQEKLDPKLKEEAEKLKGSPLAKGDVILLPNGKQIRI